MSNNSLALNWINASSFEIGGYTITLDYAHGGSQRKSSDHEFTIMKDRNFFDHYTTLQGGDFKRIMELGVYQGGSFVFLDQLLNPTKIAAVELSSVPIPSLDNYIAKNGDRMRLYYGTSQDDVARLNEIVDADFGGVLDLVVDDASHFYEPTKTSFATLFPKLRPGGLYIIEDWSWGFDPGYQHPSHEWYSQAAPANLVIDLLEDMALAPLIEDVHVSRPMIKIRRSNASGGEVFACRGRRGRVFNPL
jgi:predicted O-methyltransferase YrrM